MKTIPEIEKALKEVNDDRKELEDELSRRMRAIMQAEINFIKLEFGRVPRSIDVEFMNTSTIGEASDHYIMQDVKVRI